MIQADQIDDFIHEMPSGRSRSYTAFLNDRVQGGRLDGFKPKKLPDWLFPFQSFSVDWTLRKGKAALFYGCGLGKRPMGLAWADAVVRRTNKPVLYATTLGDSAETVQEAGEKFGIEAVRSRDGSVPSGARVVVTNYERLEKFNPADFAGAVCNESSCIKDFDGKRSGVVREMLRQMPYRLLATATPSPNDHTELGTSAESLGELGHMDMLARFFRSDDGSLHPFRTHQRGKAKKNAEWSFRPYAEQDFWRWVCSWARACRKPSDLGFSDEGYDRPPMEVRTHIVGAKHLKSGWMFETPAIGLREQDAELARTLTERCDKVAELVEHSRSAVAWCHRNAEGDRLERIIPGAVQVGSRKQCDEEKEEIFDAFKRGQIRVLVTKPIIAGLGLNWQHCAHQTYFPSNSYEQFHQALSRLDRYGQTEAVRTDLVTTEGGRAVIENLNRKRIKSEHQYANLVALMNQGSQVRRSQYGDLPVEVPAWL